MFLRLHVFHKDHLLLAYRKHSAQTSYVFSSKSWFPFVLRIVRMTSQCLKLLTSVNIASQTSQTVYDFYRDWRNWNFKGKSQTVLMAYHFTSVNMKPAGLGHQGYLIMPLLNCHQSLIFSELLIIYV